VCMMDLSGFVGFVDLCGGFRDLVVFLCFGFYLFTVVNSVV